MEKLEKQRFKKTDRPKPQREPPSDPRHIPAQVMRDVYARDGGCCTYVGPNGRRCRARAFLEFDHIEPIALGGRSTADNLRLRCFAHNQLAAREAFGDEFMAMRAPARSDRSDPLVPERAACSRLLAPPGEDDLRSAIRSRFRRNVEANPVTSESRDLG